MPRVRPALDMRPSEYAEAKRKLTTDEFHKAQREQARRSDEARKRKLAESDIDLLELREMCIRRGLGIEEAVNFCAEIDTIRSRKGAGQ